MITFCFVNPEGLVPEALSLSAIGVRHLSPLEPADSSYVVGLLIALALSGVTWAYASHVNVTFTS